MTVAYGQITKNEILSQPEAWAETMAIVREQTAEIDAFWRTNRPDTVIFTGCGSTYYVGMLAASALRRCNGADARAVPASELLLYPDMVYPRSGTVALIAISRSGSTSETVKVCRDFLASERGPLLTITGYPDEPLAALGELNLIIPAAREESIVQTRAFTSLSIASIAVAAIGGGANALLDDLDKLPAAGQAAIDGQLAAMSELATAPIERIFVLGSGPHYAIACEAGLKSKEVTLTPAEPFHFLEFRHGPKSLVTPETLVIGLLSGVHDAIEQPVLNEMAAYGGQVLSFGETGAKMTFASGLDELARCLLPLPAIQWFACERALAQGYDPDHPRNLTAVISLNLD